jgi:hypothetical protein
VRRLLVIAALACPTAASASPVLTTPRVVDAVRVPRLIPAYTVAQLQTPELRLNGADRAPRWLSADLESLRAPRFQLPSELSHQRKLLGADLGLSASARTAVQGTVSAEVEMALCLEVAGIHVQARVGGRSQLRSGSTAEDSVWLPTTTAQARLRARLPGTTLDPRLVIETPFDPIDPAGRGAGATRFLAVVDALRF